MRSVKSGASCVPKCRAVVILFLALLCSEAGAEDDRRPYYAQAGGPAGLGTYEPGKWGAAAVQLVNPTKVPAEVLSLLNFRGNSNIQFGRRVWIPPRARRLTWFPIRAPESAPARKNVWEVQSFLFDVTTQSETPIPAAFGQMQIENILPLSRGPALTGLIVDDEHEDAMRELIWAVRLARNYRKTVSVMNVQRLPPTVECLDGLDQLVIATDQVFADTAACIAIREWLHRGGQLWILLDRVEPELVSRLTGDAFQVSVVDRIDLTRLQFHSHDAQGQRPSGEERKFDHPIEMVRAVFTGFRASHTVDGWPAAAWTKVGRGNLLVTTVGSRAWLRGWAAGEHAPAKVGDAHEGVFLVATEPLQEVAFELLTEAEPPPLTPGDFEESVSEQIGYRIASRGKVGALLGAFSIGLVVIGMFLARRDSLEHLGWLGSVAVVLTSVSLLAVGRASREAVPRAVAVTQFVETSSFTDEFQVTGLAAAYSPDKSFESLVGSRGGRLTPELDVHGGTVLRMISTDRDKWELHNLVLPAGQQLVPFSNSYHVSHPVTATATFGPNGLYGQISVGPFEQSSDAILALPSGHNMAVNLSDKGHFTSGMNDVLVSGQFLSESLLSDEQRRRMEIYHLLFRRHDDRSYPEKPTLLMWARPLDLGFRILEGVEQTGSALVSIPLDFTSPAPGTPVVIPAPLVSYRAVGAETSFAYDNRRRKWSGPFNKGLDTVLRFRIPQQVLPIQLDSVTLTIDIKAPSRELQILGLLNGEFTILDSRRSPLGKLGFEIDRADVLQVNSDGDLTLGINVGDARDGESNRLLDPSEAQTWTIEDLQLELTGKTVAQ
ncbi:MAG: hypothetical protein KDA72_00015 [Planctomycetales bacterium]|nr:hypothetical protein [Planctomycetales bacterium]